ncbi:acyl-CoA transferase [Gluconacetobacter sacchari DSM 12717]|uniref:CoA transferase n=2 Tax=Gluconacetobacter sacchari TaxID=92759 RepID=A0A7W4IFB6_9PROT|nr:CoA transferase [Gluconacetobacter sacchari]MBB2161799.1 CoA transferase [Gluconacetobacter sacchari]GBQ20176.1 acyl-CoA transferase [Gluconacetobacter sacchari DSM 12717]
MQTTVYEALTELMAIRGGVAPAPGEVAIHGQDPIFETPYRVGETMAQIFAACGVAANDLWKMKTGRRQSIDISVSAAASTVKSGGCTSRREDDGAYTVIPGSDAMKHMVSLTQPWPTADGKWFLPHTNLPHLERRILDLLKCESTPESISSAIRKWNALELEDAIAEAKACGGMVRTAEEWLAHPQGAYLAERPVVELTKVGENVPQALRPGDMPLSGVRVLDLTRILAGPTCGLSLTEFGADDLMVTAPHLPQVPEFVRDTSHGKRSCFLDFTNHNDAARLVELVREADILIDGYRPARLAAHGFGWEDLKRMRPGLIHVSVNCFGSGGPFGGRAGWDQVAQAVTGMCHTQGLATGAGQPQLTPVYMCDYAAGRLGSFGAMLALARRAREGGSYRVQVSLCQSAMLFQRQGFVTSYDKAPGGMSDAEVREYQVDENGTCYGDLRCLGPVLQMSETPCRWSRVTPQLGSDTATWLPR